MKARVNTFLNIRTGTPEILPNNNPLDKYYSPGDVIEVVEIVNGQEYKGNSIWFKLDTGVFVWSGGIDDNPKTGAAALAYTNAEIAKLALEQNLQYLKIKFPNILSISDTVYDFDNTESHVIVLYLDDNNASELPDKLEVKMPDGMIRTIPTEIIKDVGSGSISVNQKDEISNGKFHGSVCCIVDTGNDLKLATAGHVFSEGRSTDFGGELAIELQTQAKINKSVIGNWFFQVINSRNDVALASIDNFMEDNGCISFRDKDHYEVKDQDVRKTKVKVISNVSNPKTRDAYILDYNTVWGVKYNNEKIIKSNIIVIGNSTDRNKSGTVSQGGDSGGCVYEPISGNLVGLILGGNSRFTWVLPLKEIFDEYNYKLS